jgi:hypothetical protein
VTYSRAIRNQAVTVPPRAPTPQAMTNQLKISGKILACSGILKGFAISPPKKRSPLYDRGVTGELKMIL